MKKSLILSVIAIFIAIFSANAQVSIVVQSGNDVQVYNTQYLDEAIKIDPNYPNAVLTMGLALAQSGKPKEGIPFIEKAGKLGVAQAPMILQMLKNM